MKIPSLFKNKKPIFSFEVFPPKRKANLDSIYETIEKLSVCKPDFISVTYGAGGNKVDDTTCQIAKNIKEKFNIEPVAHLTCVNSSMEDVQNMIGRFAENNIENVLALRGDIIPGEIVKKDFSHANELAIEVQRKSDLQILGACYPEGHCESKNIREDIQNLKYKIGAGVKVLITQLFFDNQLFYNYLVQVRNAGIDIPISAGIMPIVNKKQIEKTVALSGASLPHEFTKMISLYENDEQGLYEHGIQYAVDQITDLIEYGVDGIHLYTMNNPKVALEIYEKIKVLL
ncbi:MAG: methylenetetrahydrofolate reductase [NAD(P)H] [Anaerovoracaceae bacterium]